MEGQIKGMEKYILTNTNQKKPRAALLISAKDQNKTQPLLAIEHYILIKSFNLL